MKAKYIIVMLLVIVLSFLWTGYRVSTHVEKNMESSFKEFEVVTKMLSPMLDTYRSTVVDGQVKVTHNQMSIEEYCVNMSKNMEKQKKLITKYAETLSGKENMDDKELFYLINSLNVYIDKMKEFCKKKDAESIHTSLYSGELYRLVDPIISRSNRILDNRLHNAEKMMLETKSEMEKHRQILLFSTSLAVVLGAAILFSRNLHVVSKPPFEISKKKVSKKKK